MSEGLKNFDRIHWVFQPKLGATGQLASNVVRINTGDLPERVIKITKLILLDSFGCILIGKKRNTSSKVLNFVKTQGGKPECTIIPDGFLTNRYHASLVNGTNLRSWRIDSSFRNVMFCSAVVVPAVLAVAEKELREGNSLISAIALGIETMCRLQISSVYVPSTRPLDPTSTFGPFGAAVASMKLLSGDEFDMENAISLCAAQAAAPIRAEKSHSEVADLHGGFAASYGIRCAYMSREGLSGARQILEGNMGFFQCISGLHDDERTPRYNVDLINKDFGEFWYMNELQFLVFPPKGRFEEADENILSVESFIHGLSESINFDDSSWDRLELKFNRIADMCGIEKNNRKRLLKMIGDLENVDDVYSMYKLIIK